MITRYRKKGTYPDGRTKYIIEVLEGGKISTISLPKPEILIKLLDVSKRPPFPFEKQLKTGREK